MCFQLHWWTAGGLLLVIPDCFAQLSVVVIDGVSEKCLVVLLHFVQGGRGWWEWHILGTTSIILCTWLWHVHICIYSPTPATLLHEPAIHSPTVYMRTHILYMYTSSTLVRIFTYLTYVYTQVCTVEVNTVSTHTTTKVHNLSTYITVLIQVQRTHDHYFTNVPI